MDDCVDLIEKKQFRVMLHPVRQEMLHLLRLWGKPVSANRMAERMHLSPSGAQSHLRKLVDLGVVAELERTREDGVKLYYYQARNVKLRLCLGRDDAFQGEREALAANLTDGTFRSLLSTSYRHDEKTIEEYGVLRFGALHMTTEQRRGLMEVVDQYLDRLGVPQPNAKEHWEYVLLAFRAEEET